MQGLETIKTKLVGYSSGVLTSFVILSEKCRI